MNINIRKEVEIEPTHRTELLSAMFEVPARTKLSVELTGELPISDKEWKIGLIVGPSGSGKTLLLENLFNKPEILSWNRKSVIDDFPSDISMEDISRVCQSVGFNTIPSWLRPYSVLSNGERFRAEVARRLLWPHGTICIDEFTSVVDRQVAQFACHAIQKYIRGCEHKQLIVASCHYDILNWLQPDWILEPGNPCRFTWRSLRSRPPIGISVSRVEYKTWGLFRDFHYMSAELNRAARCYGLYVNSTELPDGVEEQFYDNDLHPSENRRRDVMDSRSRLRLSSTGYNRSSDDGQEHSESMDTERRSLSEDGRESNPLPGLENTTDSEPAPIGSVFHESVSNQQNGMVSSQPTEQTKISAHVHGSMGPRLSTYRIASMCGVLYRPHPRVSDIYGFTRMVTLPDFQGLGLAFVLACKVASAYKALGKRLHSYPNHPAWIRSYQRSKDWMQVKTSGEYSPSRGRTSTVGGFGGRRCAVFMFVGSPMNVEDAERLIHVD